MSVEQPVKIGDTVIYRDSRHPERKDKRGKIIGIDRSESRKSDRSRGTILMIIPDDGGLTDERWSFEITGFPRS